MAIAKNITDQTTDQRIYVLRKSAMYPNRFVLSLFLLFCVNTVIPVIDIPLFGLSITSVFFALVALEVILKLKFLGIKYQARWILLAYGFGFGSFVSIFANGIFGTLNIQIDSFITLIQVAYWLGVFLVTIALFSNLQLPHIHNVIWVLGVAVFAIGSLRLFEAVVFNRIGPSTAQIFTQNAYGILFSTFAPFALILPFMTQRARVRVMLVLLVFALLLAIGINGSRSSWLATAIGAVIIAVLLMISRRRNVFALVATLGIAIIVSALLISVLPTVVIDTISSRLLTLERVEEDKSFATRALMQQKSILLFESSPLYGVGRGQFRNAHVSFDFADTPFGVNPRTDFNQIASHNTYAQMLGETGLAGMIPLAVLLLLLLLLGSKAATGLSKDGHVWAIAIFASFIAMSIHMWSIDNLNTTGPWFVYGLCAGMIEYERRRITGGLN